MSKVDFLFIRLLESCNANCFMCQYAESKDDYRLSLKDFALILEAARKEGVKYIRFTGGEPLKHEDILTMVRLVAESKLKSSIITNGLLLPKMVQNLALAGLNQVIVSIDSPYAEQHDRYRNTRSLFDKAIQGIIEAKKLGIKTRVNTVCGPHNFRQMIKLQELLTELGVLQWELSSLKLERPLSYTDEDILEAENINRYIYEDAKKNNRLIPLGKIWCGNNEKERQEYFHRGVTPRPDGQCLIVDRVRYLDAKNRRLYTCSLVPHRPDAEQCSAYFEDYSSFTINNGQTEKQAGIFRMKGAEFCTGCSTTAAGLAQHTGDLRNESCDWYY